MRPGFLAIPCFLAIAAGSAVAQGPERAVTSDVLNSAVEPVRALAIIVMDGRIRSGIERLERKSALWRDALERVADLDRRVLIVTPDRIVVRDGSGALDVFDGSTLAEVSPVPGSNGAIDVVMVVINVALLDSLHARLGSSRAEFEADVERVLAHEVYGHAIPYLLAGSVEGRCPDPRPGESARDSCSIRRENDVRREAGLGERNDYELKGLALGRRLASAGDRTP
jgi:hypothetical protein